MLTRRLARVAASLSAMCLITGCAGDPDEVAARGAVEVERHATGPWARLDVVGVRELDAETLPAAVDRADPGRLFDFDAERGTTFVQRFEFDDADDVMTDLRNHLVAQGARVSFLGCSDDHPALRSWSFYVESLDDVMALRLHETPVGVTYTASLPNGANRDLFQKRLDEVSATPTVRVVPPPPPCPRPGPPPTTTR